MDLASCDNQNPVVLPPRQCGVFLLTQALNQSVSPFFFPLQDLNLEAKTLSGTGLVFDEQLNEFHCLWDDR